MSDDLRSDLIKRMGYDPALPRPAELWTCSHTRKCRWAGSKEDLVWIDDDRFALSGSRGTCPQCGDDSFYVKKSGL